MKIKLACFIVAIGVLTTSNAVFAEMPASQPKLEQTISPKKLALARQLVQLDGSAVALTENDLGFTLLTKGNKTQTSQADNYVQEYLAKNSPLEAIIHIYAQELTVQELTGAIEFYKSPVGQSLSKKTSIITQKYAEQRTDILMRAFEYAQNKLEQKKQSK